jgi:hypothetical protein
MAIWGLILQHELTASRKTTLKRRIDGSNINDFGHEQLSGRAADLPEEVEHDLVSNVVQVGERHFGLKRKYFR